MSTFLTASIPYINASPHLGYAYELVQADITARALRQRGDDVVFATGTDDNSLKNVLAAEAVGEPTDRFVARHAAEFVDLHELLDLSVDEVVHTGRDQRHHAAVDRIWCAAAANGDLYQQTYEGLYCVGCEQFWKPEELIDGRCPEHGTVPETIEENNWFFRLSRYQDHVRSLIESDTLRVRPEAFRREVVAFVEAGLEDISVSRSAQRARGWGIPVPDDPSQVIYVWFDALTNYLSALDWASDENRGLWADFDERIHVIGKGISRFHAVFWPAFLEAAGEPPPTEVRVHPYLTVEGAKISKSGLSAASPGDVVDLVSADGLRWYFARDVNPISDTDVSVQAIVDRVNDELANGIANAVNRLVTLANRNLGGDVPDADADATIVKACTHASAALCAFDHRGGSAAISHAIQRLNAEINATEPWVLARDPERLPELADVLARHLQSARRIAAALQPICPQFARRLDDQLTGCPLPCAAPTFPRIA